MGGGGGDEGPDDPVPRRRPPRPSRSAIATIGVVTLLIAAIALANSSTEAPADRRSVATGDEKPPAAERDHSRAGAKSTARRYAERVGGTEMLATTSRHRLLREISDPAHRTAILSRYDAAYSTDVLARLGLDAQGRAAKGREVVNETLPARATVVDYQPDRATVAVWCSGLFGIKGDTLRPVETTYFTLTVTLTWTPQGWRFLESQQREGPQPDHS